MKKKQILFLSILVGRSLKLAETNPILLVKLYSEILFEILKKLIF